VVTLGDIDPGFGPGDDRRHWPATAGGRMRDSLFWELIMPEEKLGLQIYLYVSDRGRAGYNVSVWGQTAEPVALQLAEGTVDAAADFDEFEFGGLTVRQPELRRTCEVRYESEDVRIAYDFTALHDAFSYRSNPDGLPVWFAQNRLEQTGHVTGFLEVAGRRIDWDRTGRAAHAPGPGRLRGDQAAHARPDEHRHLRGGVYGADRRRAGRGPVRDPLAGPVPAAPGGSRRTGAVRPMTELLAGQLAQLETFLRSRGICRGPLTARPVGDGHSNLTFRVSDGHRQGAAADAAPSAAAPWRA